ncbi:MAG TPA: cupin domain-containing protein [Actinomycetota bacterium]
MDAESASILGPGEGRTFHIGLDPVTVKFPGSDTGAGFAVIESVVSPGVPGPPPHIHRDGLAECWYVLDGELEFLVGDSARRAPSGSFAYVPPGVVHTFSNPGEGPARFIGMFSIARGLSMLEEFAAAFPAEGGPPDEGRIADVFRRFDVEVVP